MKKIYALYQTINDYSDLEDLDNVLFYESKDDAIAQMTEEFNDKLEECQLMKEDSDTLCYLEADLDDNGANIHYIDYTYDTRFCWYIKAVYVNMPQPNLDAI